MSDAADKRIAELEKEKAGIEEMLALVLMTVNEPIEISYEFLKHGIKPGTQIKIEDDINEQKFVFSMEYPK